jgi:hypothetical protein
MHLGKLITALLLGLSSAANAQDSLFVLHYDERFDEQCSASRGYSIKAEWSNELKDRLPEMQTLWKAIAPPMLAAVKNLTGKSIDPPASPIRLTLCDLPSQSKFGTSVNMRFALRAFTEQPVPLRYKADTAFHEVLHPFVSRYAPKTSPLLRQHDSESGCIRNHLHLLALQKAVLLSLAAEKELEQVTAIDSKLPSGMVHRQ